MYRLFMKGLALQAELGTPPKGRPAHGGMMIKIECSPTAAPEFEVCSSTTLLAVTCRRIDLTGHNLLFHFNDILANSFIVSSNLTVVLEGKRRRGAFARAHKRFGAEFFGGSEWLW